MWPGLVAPGSEWGQFVAAVIMVTVGAIMSFAASNVRPPEPDPLADPARSYKRGDVRLWEAERRTTQ